MTYIRAHAHTEIMQSGHAKVVVGNVIACFNTWPLYGGGMDKDIWQKREPLARICTISILLLRATFGTAYT